MDSSWDNSYCVRLVIVSLAMNIRKRQSLVSEDNFFCWLYDDFCSDFLLYDVIDFIRIKKWIVESCLDKRSLDSLSSFETCWSSLLRLLKRLRRSLLRIDKGSLFETLISLKITNFGYTSSCLQFLRKFMSNFSLFFLYSTFSYLQKQ